MFDASGQIPPPPPPYTQQHHSYPPRYGYRPMPPPPPPKPISRGLADIFHLPRLQNSFIYHSWQVIFNIIIVIIILYYIYLI